MRTYEGSGICQWCGDPATVSIENVPAVHSMRWDSKQKKKVKTLIKRAVVVLSCDDCVKHAQEAPKRRNPRKLPKEQTTIADFL